MAQNKDDVSLGKAILIMDNDNKKREMEVDILGFVPDFIIVRILANGKKVGLPTSGKSEWRVTKIEYHTEDMTTAKDMIEKASVAVDAADDTMISQISSGLK